MLLSQTTSLLGCLARSCMTDVVVAAGLRLLSTTSYAAAGASVVLQTQPDKPVLITLPKRGWGAPPNLSAEVVNSIIGTQQSSPRIGVLREPFASFDQPQRPLSQLIRCLGGGAVAVATEVAHTPHSRVVVDEYVRQVDGSYSVRSVATDLLRFLKAQGARVALLPDVSKTAGSTAVTAATRGVSQCSNEVLMVAPTAFGFNEQAAQDNSFMHQAPKPGEGSDLTRQVLKEFAGLHHQLTEVAGVRVTLYEHSLQHGTPDACFPNNWFSTHPAGEGAGGTETSTLVLYPMKHPNRSAERRADIIGLLKQRGYGQLYDMSPEEKNNRHLEGTGVLVNDRVNGVAYVDISERADESLAQAWVKKLGYRDLVTFRSTDLRGKSVYHTNVMMAIGTGVAIVCAESVRDTKERERLLSALNKTHEVVEISLQQMDALCGNALEVKDSRGLPVMAMSTQAYNAFTPAQRAAILKHTAGIVHAPIDTLERVGGGSVRCTLAELF